MVWPIIASAILGGGHACRQSVIRISPFIGAQRRSRLWARGQQLGSWIALFSISGLPVIRPEAGSSGMEQNSSDVGMYSGSIPWGGPAYQLSRWRFLVGERFVFLAARIVWTNFSRI